MGKSKEELELDEYLKNTKKDDKDFDRKDIGKKEGENKNQNTIINELDEYMKKISESNRVNTKKAKGTNKESSGIGYDFMKVTNHTIEDITMSINKAIDKKLEDITYSFHKSANKMIEDVTYSLHNLRNPQDKKLEVNINTNNIQEKESVKQDVKKFDMKNELDKYKNTDKELYKNLEAINRMTNREMKYLNETYNEYNKLINLADECNLILSYNQRMSGIKIYGESKRSIKAQQKELVDILKGETKEYQALKSSKKSMKYLESAEKKIQNLKNKNKFLDFKGKRERKQIINDIKKEIERHEQILKDNGISCREDFNKLKDKVNSREDYAKRVISLEKKMYEQERAEIEKSGQLEKQVEKNSQNQQQHYYKKDKEAELER